MNRLFFILFIMNNNIYIWALNKTNNFSYLFKTGGSYSENRFDSKGSVSFLGFIFSFLFEIWVKKRSKIKAIIIFKQIVTAMM